jgi:5-methylcytosine-specific restriction endonuclease McrA
MKWNYICPKCQIWRKIEWDSRQAIFNCHNTNESYSPPTPSQQHIAYFDTREWPSEMETVVVNLKGKKCTVPGCNKDYESLDHRIAYANGGKTSVENLFPMCTDHNSSKGDKDYETWLREIGK